MVGCLTGWGYNRTVAIAHNHKNSQTLYELLHYYSLLHAASYKHYKDQHIACHINCGMHPVKVKVVLMIIMAQSDSYRFITLIYSEHRHVCDLLSFVRDS